MKNRLFKKRLFRFIFCLLFLLIFPFFLTPSKAQALTCESDACFLYVRHINDNQHITWQVRSAANIGNGYGSWQAFTVSPGGGTTDYMVGSYAYGDPMPSSVTVEWAQSCVDPSSTTNVAASGYDSNGDATTTNFYAVVGVSCTNPGLSACSVNLSESGTTGYASSGLSPSDYAACEGLNDTSRTVGLCNVCPSTSACAVNGLDIGTGECAANCASGYTCTSTGSSWGSCGPQCSCTTTTPTATSATQTCAVGDTVAPEQLSWSGTNTSVTFWSCDETKAESYTGRNGQPVKCTIGSTPTNGTTASNNAHAGWFISKDYSSSINSITVNSSSPFPANSDVNSLPLIQGDQYYWYVTATNNSCASADSSHTNNFTAASCTVSPTPTETPTPVCAADHYNCAVGTSSGTTGDTATQYNWTCTNGASIVNCSQNRTSNCVPAPEGTSSCDANGNVTGVDFGITNSNVWIQSTGSDIYQSGGISNIEPSDSVCGSYMSISQTPTIQMPGLILTGNGSADFGAGDASLNNWVVGEGTMYPNTLTLPAVTSYQSVSGLLSAAGITPTPLTCDSGTPTTGCILSSTLTPGVYSVNGDLTLIGTGNTYTFPEGGAFTFLIDGNLTIKTALHVPVGSIQDETGSFVLFTVSKDINVDSSVGTATKTDTTPNLEGYFSTDQNFIVQGTNSCPTADLKLNVAGAIVTNATNASPSRGSFQINRDACGNDDCPTFAVQARPDFVLNAPSYLEPSDRIWQEVAP